MNEKLEARIYREYKTLMRKTAKKHGKFPEYQRRLVRIKVSFRFNILLQEVERIAQKFESMPAETSMAWIQVDAFELKVYSNYRAMATKRLGGGDPVYTKQEVRDACVKRYNIPYGELKRIIAKYRILDNPVAPPKNNRPAWVNNPQEHVTNR